MVDIDKSKDKLINVTKENTYKININNNNYCAIKYFEDKNILYKKNINDPIFKFLFLIFNKNKIILKKLKNIHDFLNKYTFYYLINILFFYLNILGFISYKKTLIGCKGTQNECLNMDLVNFFKNLVIYMIYSFLIAGITITLSIWKYLSIFQILFIVFNYYLLYKEDHYSTLYKHGQYNFIILISGISIVSLFLNIFFILKKLISNRINLTIYFIILLLLYAFIKTINIIKNKSNCSQWEWGLNNTNINKNNYNSECSIIIPKNCPMYAYYGIMDFSKFSNINCKNINAKDYKDLLLKYLILDNNYNFSNTTKFGYPNSNLLSIYNISNTSDFNKQIISKIIDMDNKTILNNITQNEKPEIILEFSNNYNDVKININISYNEELVKIRKIKENNKSIYNNILFIFFDTLSRVHFQRTMKKTAKFLERYMLSQKGMHNAYQFNKFHSLGGYTLPNISPMFYGTSYKSQKGQNIIKHFKENGYITAQISNICSKELFEVEGKKNTSIKYENYDHENIGMWCDPNYYDRKDPYPINKGEFSVLRRCLYGKEAYEYVLEYTQQFWEKYNNSKKFARISFIEGHEITGEVIKYLDQPIYNFLETFMNNGYFNNTIVFVCSDHGLHYGLYIDTKREDALIEHYLPLLIILLPKDNDKIKRNEIINNQDKFITAYDIFNTLLFISNGDLNYKEYSNKGISLFEYINPKGRNCKQFEDEIGNECKCILNQ